MYWLVIKHDGKGQFKKKGPIEAPNPENALYKSGFASSDEVYIYPLQGDERGNPVEFTKEDLQLDE
jgi:hypothetical protein